MTRSFGLDATSAVEALQTAVKRFGGDGPMKIWPATRRQGAAPMRPRMASAGTQVLVCKPAPPSPAILARNREVQRGLGLEEGRFLDFRSGISSDNRILYSSISTDNAIGYRNIMEARVGIEPTNKRLTDS